MKTILPISLLCGFFLILVPAVVPGMGQPAVADDLCGPVTVEVASGRRFTADVDTRTNETQLWLRWDPGSYFILRPIDWDRVVRVWIGEETYSAAQFHWAINALRRLFPNLEAAGGGRSERIGSRRVEWAGAGPAAAGPSEHGPASAPQAGASEGETSRVRSLAIEVQAANWDGDVETDGLVVDVYPLDADGAVVPVHGGLEINLIGQRTGIVEREQRPRRLGRWTEQARPSDFGHGGARYRLPFGSIHPEFDLQWAPYAAVHARLSVPGQGVFETTESVVRVRPYSGVRDRLQQTTGRRFFALERTGRGGR